ncbi:MAG: hypothetical protein IT317_13700 [Anaerolineales bacterium]|nr:hypothetical protein [Anaerolineales bacterium]
MTTQRNTAMRRLNRAIERFRATDWHSSHFGQLSDLAEELGKLQDEIETHIDRVVSYVFDVGGEDADQIAAELEGEA